MRILFEVRSGEVELTPRTDIGGGGSIDINGDGIPDLVLEEVSLPCRVIEDVPTSTPIGRRARQAAIAGLELTFETLGTYSGIPGFTTPATFQYETYATEGAWEVGFRSDRAQYVDWGDGTSSQGINPVKQYAANSGRWTVTVVSFSRVIPQLQWSSSSIGFDGSRSTPRIDLTGTDFSDFEIEDGGAIILVLRSGRQFVGNLTSVPGGTPSRWLADGSTYQTSLVPRSIDSIELRAGTQPLGDVNDLPSNMNDMRFRAGFTSGNRTLKQGGPVGKDTTQFNARIGNVRFGADFEYSNINSNGLAPKMKSLFLAQGEQPGPLMRGMRQLESVRGRWQEIVVDLSNGAISPLLTEFAFTFTGIEVLPGDPTWLDQMETLTISNTRNSLARSLSIFNGTRQFNLLWRDLYARRNALQSTLDLNLTQLGFGASENEVICTATDPNDLWQMVGYRDHKGDSVLDNIQSLTLSNLLNFSAARTGVTTLELDWNIPRNIDARNDPDRPFENAYTYDDSTANNQPMALVRQGTSGFTDIDIFTQGEQVRLQGASTDELVEIDTVTYDSADDKLTLTINDGSGNGTAFPSSAISVPTGINKAIYAFYFQSDPN